MPKAASDLTGHRFGRLVAIKRSDRKNRQGKRLFWICQCDCGNFAESNISDLRRGHTNSCGCYHKEKVSECTKRTHTTHGESHSSMLYRRWKGMKDRCYNPNNKHYNRYGGRGIKVCDDWHKSYVAFRDWAIKYGFKEELSIDRIDNDGDYSPNNCRWADTMTQYLNRPFKRDEFGSFIAV